MCTCSLLGFEYEEILCTLKFFVFLASTGLIAVQTFDKVRKSLSVTGPVKKVSDEKVFSPAASACTLFLQLNFPL
jgi:hypothetical protein